MLSVHAYFKLTLSKLKWSHASDYYFQSNLDLINTKVGVMRAFWILTVISQDKKSVCNFVD